jgi:hypothetical protein
MFKTWLRRRFKDNEGVWNAVLNFCCVGSVFSLVYALVLLANSGLLK